MKKFLLGCLFLTMVSGMLLGNEYYQTLDRAENYIKKNYSGSIASQQALNDLASIAAGQGNRAAKIAKIKEAFPNAFISKEVLEYRKAAEQGDAKAQFKLGMCYENGDGVEENCNEAIKWYEKSAQQGLAEAQYQLGVCYYFKYGYEDNKSFDCIRKAAEQGHIKAQYQLGIIYEKGYGIKKDPQKAVKWYRNAAKQGDKNAQEALERLKK